MPDSSATTLRGQMGHTVRSREAITPAWGPTGSPVQGTDVLADILADPADILADPAAVAGAAAAQTGAADPAAGGQIVDQSTERCRGTEPSTLHPRTPDSSGGDPITVALDALGHELKAVDLAKLGE